LFDELKEVPASATFAVDESTTRLAIPPASGLGWYNYNPQLNIITPIPGRVLIVRTGDGRFAKVEILSYYKDAPANPDQNSIARHYTFRYVFQPDGSQRLSN
ncbi:MAG: HmuY family protein, partial [Runella sp.]